MVLDGQLEAVTPEPSRIDTPLVQVSIGFSIFSVGKRCAGLTDAYPFNHQLNTLRWLLKMVPPWNLNEATSSIG